MIYLDPTETRAGTRLPKRVIRSCSVLPGLESATGADMILCNASLPSIFDREPLSRPATLALKQAVWGGAILVQRKSGGDFLSSIPHLAGIEHRMLEWARPGGCWLLVTDLGQALAEATARSSPITPEAVEGAFLWWQLRGGHVAVLGSDGDIGPWLNGMHQAVKKLEVDDLKLVVRDIVEWPPLQVTLQERDSWMSTGSAFPRGWGRAKREAVWQSLYRDGLPPTLINAYIRVCQGETKIPGIGEKLTQALRAWVGWTENALLAFSKRSK